MNTPVTTLINVGKHTFKIIERKMSFGGDIISYTFKIGGDYDDCVNLAYNYKNGVPTVAKLPHLMYEPECTIGSNLEKGTGSELLIKTLLRYAYGKIQSIHLFNFDDMSHIDCEEKDLTRPPPRKQKRPLKLAYFSIAYNSKTWYEKHFNATMVDKDRYNKYRARIQFLTTPAEKVNFKEFLEIATPPSEQFEILRRYYEPAKTYREFFNNIPYGDRCNLLLPWLHNFILHYLKDVYTDNNWEIDINKMDNISGGNKKNKTKRNTRRLYPSKYKIINYIEMHNF